MIIRYLLRDRSDSLWFFASWDMLVSWVKRHSCDAPFEYCDTVLCDVTSGNSFVPFTV